MGSNIIAENAYATGGMVTPAKLRNAIKHTGIQQIKSVSTNLVIRAYNDKGNVSFLIRNH